MSGVLQGSVLGSVLFNIFIMIWMRGLSAPSVSLQITPNWAGGLIYLGLLLGSQQPQATLQAWGRVAGKPPSRKEPGDAG